MEGCIRLRLHGCNAVIGPFMKSMKEFIIAVMNVMSRLGYILLPSWDASLFLSMAMLSKFEWI